jgi:flagellar M-ring protein FliF
MWPASFIERGYRMSLLNQLSQITKNLAGLGQTKLFALVGVGALSIFLIIGSAIFLNQPTRETLYIGLSGEDMTQISLVLAEANIDFASGTDGKFRSRFRPA